MVDKAKAAGTLYMWTYQIEQSDNILENPHYSLESAEIFIDRYLRPDEEQYLKEHYLQEIEDETDTSQFKLTEKGKVASGNVYDHVQEENNGNIQQFIDWADEETVESLLT
ncbi:MAG: hypothetical protein ACI977_000087 [Candidatus Nanohaloarchaea archaeon]|jgi:hypothetical protein